MNLKGIILQVRKYSDSDLILEVLTQRGHLLSFIAKGARKSKKRFLGGVLEPINLVQISYQEPKNKSVESTLYFLSEAQLVYSFDALRSDYERLELAFYFVKYLKKVSFEGVSDAESLFNLLGHSLKVAETIKDLSFLKRCFELKLLFYLGILPPGFYNSEILSTPMSKINEIQNRKILPLENLLNEIT